MKTEAWNGWLDYGKVYVNRLNSQDWALYIICPSIELALGKPLTFTEISEYLKLLPDDISRERKVSLHTPCSLSAKFHTIMEVRQRRRVTRAIILPLLPRPTEKDVSYQDLTVPDG